MTWRQLQLVAAAGALAGAYLLGFCHGRMSGRENALKSAVAAYQARERINHEIESLGAVDLCIALGGVPDECDIFMRGLDKAASGE